MNKGLKTIILILLAVLIAAPGALAVTRNGHIMLLAVYQEGDTFKGSPADVALEIKDGTGRVFLETIPLSKVDTQISTRFAKEMACSFAEADCDRYDFFYTIKSTAGIVGGPSAGGAISALTVAMLKDLEVDQETAMTGTINSGELIGPVGSLKEKVEAAKEAGIKVVLVPGVQAQQKEDNITNIVEYGKEIGVEVVPVTTLGDAVSKLTGVKFEEIEKEVEVPDTYKKVMEDVAGKLCSRTEEMLSQIDVFNLSDRKEIPFGWVQLQTDANNLTEKGKKALEEGNFYSAASYCFGAGVKANTMLHDDKNLGEEEKAEEASELRKKVNDFDKATERRQKETITDLQTYMIVKERILEARQYLETGKNDSATLSYVAERLNSAVVWSEFFSKGGEEYNLDSEALKSSCSEILGEVDERFQYLNLFFPGLLNDLRNNLLTAHKHYQDGNYALCVYLASRTKAEANIMVTMLGVKEEVVDELLKQKLKAAKRAVTKQIEKGTFPIIAYSYYEYATSLSSDNKYAALIYAEYALELSDIDIYFEKQKQEGLNTDKIRQTLKEYIPTAMFVWGLVLGYLFCWVVMRERRKTRKATAETERLLSSRPKRQTRTGIRLR
jgi:uncharacterized protein